MAAACALAPTGMCAVLGGDPAGVVAAIEALGLTPANQNGAGQIVAAGALDALAKLADEPPAGARVRPLPVAGAFHTRYMAPAEDALADYVDGIDVRDPRPILLSNADGTAVASGAELIERLVAPGDPAGPLGPVPTHTARTSASARRSSWPRPGR